MAKMSKREAGSIAGANRKRKCLEEYYKNPNKCLACGKTIEVRDSERPSDARAKKFCNRSERATYYNTRRKKPLPDAICEDCGATIRRERSSSGWISQRRFCNDCIQRRKSADPEAILIPNSRVGRGCLKKYLIKHNLIPYKCQQCGGGDSWEGKPLVLVIDHINGIRNDNRIENLRFLCPNCNSQMDTFCGKNTRKVKAKKLR